MMATGGDKGVISQARAKKKVKLWSLIAQMLVRPLVHVITLSGLENISVLVAML